MKSLLGVVKGDMRLCEISMSNILPHCVPSGGSTVSVYGANLHSALQPQMLLSHEGKVIKEVSSACTDPEVHSEDLSTCNEVYYLFLSYIFLSLSLCLKLCSGIDL